MQVGELLGDAQDGVELVAINKLLRAGRVDERGGSEERGKLQILPRCSLPFAKATF